ncbi:MAG: S-methyl-5-thioribose-1-phosphate isomerase [Vicinamibacteria bacterium]
MIFWPEGYDLLDTIRWEGDAVAFLDQTLLPTRESYLTCRSAPEVAAAITNMVVRGAPAIGVSAAMGIALGIKQASAKDERALRQTLNAVCELMRQTRPTAVNLFWAIERMKSRFEELLAEGPTRLAEGLEEEALEIQREDIVTNRRMGKHGAELVPDGARILTHCNAGALATAGYGTALGVVRAAVEAGKKVEVYADETRPFLQGARLTTWELAKDEIPVTLITDNMSGHLMARKKIDLVVVGADRIAANGDVANKIGTYTVAVLAREHGIPFYAVAPTSTFDLSIPSGDQIPIEQRDPCEVTHFQGVPIVPEGVRAEHPAFDVTPHRYVTAIVCENGVARSPFAEALRRLSAKTQAA